MCQGLVPYLVPEASHPTWAVVESLETPTTPLSSTGVGNTELDASMHLTGNKATSYVFGTVTFWTAGHGVLWEGKLTLSPSLQGPGEILISEAAICQGREAAVGARSLMGHVKEYGACCLFPSPLPLTARRLTCPIKLVIFCGGPGRPLLNQPPLEMCLFIIVAH